MTLGREELEAGERELSSTRRELLGAERALLMRVGPAATQLRDCEVIFLIDNQGAAGALELGSRRPAHQAIVMRIHRHCAGFGVTLTPAWSRRDTGEIAICDYQGKRRDDAAWQLHPRLFAVLDADPRFGRADGAAGHSVDMFADRDNAQLPRFWSRWDCRGSAGVDAFAQRWDGENGFANPPFVLIPRVVAAARRRRIALTLVAAYDPKRLWWPLVCPGAAGVVATRRVKVRSWPFSQRGRRLLRQPKADIWVVRLDFR